MAKGAEGRRRRQQAKKEEKALAKEEAERILQEGNENDFDTTADGTFSFGGTGPNIEEDSSSSDDDDDNDNNEKEKNDDGEGEEEGPKLKKKKKTKKKTRSASDLPPQPKKEGIKTLPLVMLLILTGTTVLPALLYAGDWFGAMLQKKHVLGNIGYRLGVGPSPKKRVLSFYEKHDPTKIDDVPNILGKYYGDYPTLVKKLERKYQDYGYFLNWEEDEAPMTLAFDQLKMTRDYLGEEFHRYAPPFLKTAVRNARYNLTTLYKKGRKVWRKTIWPHLEPFLGVPDGAAQQKREDARQAREASGAGKRRRKNTEYRDDPE